MSIVPGNGALLVDTSVWVEVLAQAPRLTLGRVAGDVSRVVTCLPVIQEILQGVGDERRYRAMRALMENLPRVESPMTASLVEEAVDLYRRARRSGVTIRSSMDCLIAACALRHHLTVVHCDRDFAAVARIAPLEQVNIRRFAIQ